MKRSMVVPMLDVLDLCEPDALVRAAKRHQRRTAGADSVQRRLRQPPGQAPGRAVGAGSGYGACDADRPGGPAYRLALCRPPSSAESAALVRFLETEAEHVTSESAVAGKTPCYR